MLNRPLVLRTLGAALVTLPIVLVFACGSTPPAPMPAPEPPQDDLASLKYQPTFEPDYNRLVPQPWVEPVTKSQRDNVVVKPGSIEFPASSNPEVRDWAPGRVIVSAPGEGPGSNPLGFARRVTSLREENGTIIVETESIGLEDVVTGDFQQVIDPAVGKPVDLSKLDLDWAAANLYSDPDDIVSMPGEPLPDDDLVYYDDQGNPIVVSDPFLKKLWQAVKNGVSNAGVTLGKAAKAVVSAAKDAWVSVTPASFTGSVKLDKELNWSQSSPLFGFEIEQTFNQTGKTPVTLFMNGQGNITTDLSFNPGLQVGARIPNIGHNAKFAAWLNIDSRMQSKIALDLNLDAGLRSAGGKAGSALEETLNNDASFAADVLGQAKEKLLGSPDMKPAGGWKRTLFISKPTTQVIEAGPVPVVLTGTFQLDLECGFEAKASLKTKLAFEQNATFKFRVDYEDGKTSITQPPVFDNRKQRDIQVLGGGEVSVTCGLIPRINAFVYDTVGLFAGIRGSLVARASLDSKCDSNATSSTPKADVTVGLYGNVGVQIGARVQAPGSSYSGTKGQKAGFDIGPFEPWNKEFEIVKKTWSLDKGLGYCLPTCKNSAKDKQETDIDCGGGQCTSCVAGKACKKNSDCKMSFCSGGVCGSNHCADGVRDGDETGVDCGGSCAKCPIGKSCLVGTDCASGACSRLGFVGAGVCVADSCLNGVRDGAEEGVDCGGPTCPKCKVGKLGSSNAACESGVSDGNYCVASTCKDRIKNNGETDIDCGGESPCFRCGAGQSCNGHADCGPPAQTCDPVSKKCVKWCSDGTKDGDESDVDCGGPCVGCASGKTCNYASDCLSNVCNDGICQ